jgi:NAD(P)-dependent dehydrogenase (short-subunit alcohol dehydrogenase family)
MMSKEFVVIGGSGGISKALVDLILTQDLQTKVHCFSRKRVDFGVHQERVIWSQFDASTGAQPDFAAVNFSQFAGYAYAPGSINLKPFASTTLEQFQNDFEINFLGNVRVLQALIPRAKESQLLPSFVFFSTVAVAKGMAFHASIASSKGAVEGLCKSLAAEFAPKMRFNCIAPSLTDTPLAQPIVSREATLKASVERHPLKRIGQPQDVAALAAFLLSDASSWMTGQVIHCDGGMTL